MKSHLTEEQLANYQRDGYLSPLTVYDQEETKRLRHEFENFERRFGGTKKAAPLRADLHLLQNWAWDVVTNPRIVRPITSILGPNVLLWSTNWFIKESGDSKIVSFHQDANYWGLEPHDVATAWLALSDAHEDSGPMSFVPGSHQEELYAHTNTFAENNLLSRGQEVNRTIDESACQSAPLDSGQISIHHIRAIHGSGPNLSKDRRIGMVLRYCATHVRQTKGDDTAILVSGSDDFGHFQLLEKPDRDFGEKETATHKDAVTKLGHIIMS